jgi:hypothetical protein
VRAREEEERALREAVASASADDGSDPSPLHSPASPLCLSLSRTKTHHPLLQRTKNTTPSHIHPSRLALSRTTNKQSNTNNKTMPHVERTARTSFERDHAKDHDREVARKADRDGSGRMERHSGEYG